MFSHILLSPEGIAITCARTRTRTRTRTRMLGMSLSHLLGPPPPRSPEDTLSFARPKTYGGRHPHFTSDQRSSRIFLFSYTPSTSCSEVARLGTTVQSRPETSRTQYAAGLPGWIRTKKLDQVTNSFWTIPQKNQLPGIGLCRE